ncbi:MAG: M48 family metallopeptidase [Hyphomonadaceae bacterium]|nr:M48 family metallopeptidase [Hyphomonadaceae bacterium]
MKRAFLAALTLTLLAGPAWAQSPPPSPADIDAATQAWIATMGADAIARSNSYFEGKYWIGYAGAALTVAVCALLLVPGWFAGVRGWLEKTLKLKFLVAWGAALAFLLVLSVLTFPFDYWVFFVREHQYGISNQAFGPWLGEYLTNAGLNLVLFPLFLAILYFFVRVAKDAWWVWASAVTALFFAVIVAAAPVFISPLFNTYTPMQEGPLKADILQMAQANGVPAENVFVYDESRQSHRVSANVSGLLGTTRISLADNLLNRVSPEGVRMVTGHEIGHYVLGHVWSLIVALSLFAGALYACVHYAFKAIAKNERWGVRGLSDPAGLPLAFALFVAFAAIATPINNTIIRFHEHQADIYGVNASRAPDGFAETALLLSEYRKMHPSPLEEWFFYDHPSGYTRIHMAMQWKAHEMAAGRLPQSPLGPPDGYKPAFVVTDSAD